MSVTPHLAPRFFLVLAACSLVVSCAERRDRDADEAASATGASDASVAATSSVGATVGVGSAGVADQPLLTEPPASAQAPARPSASVSAANSKPTFAEGADGSVSMRTRTGTMVMSLRHDSVVVAFSDSMRLAIQREMKSSMKEDAESDADEKSAIGQMIKGVVKSTVTGAMREVFEKSRGFPVSSLRDVSYESGAIEFQFGHKPTWNFEHINSDDEPLLEQFHPADAARFVGAVRAQMKG